MITELTSENLSQVRNLELRQYAAIYTRIYSGFMAQIAELGLDVDPIDPEPEAAAIRARLGQAGAISRNDDKSVYVNAISPACVACQTGVGSATFFVSLECHRQCFYCFNPNQEDYDHYRSHTRDVVAELREIHAGGTRVAHLALTGGEPLLHKEEALQFYAYAREAFPSAHKRLYTCGDLVDEAILGRLRDAGLDEIRFSIRMHDSERMRERILERIALAKQFIPSVMVEMPVLPGTLERMKLILRRLDQIGIASINLLELCFPLINADVFQRKGFKLKPRPYRTLYNYWYAGGLPISRSEVECLQLVEFAREQKLAMGVHYCSLENKHTGQIYQQNAGQALPRTAYFSSKDYFLKSAKVFGADARRAARLLQRAGDTSHQFNREYNYLEFHVSRIPDLAPLNVEVGISSSVMESRGGGMVVRELKVDLTTPKRFTLATDV